MFGSTAGNQEWLDIYGRHKNHLKVDFMKVADEATKPEPALVQNRRFEGSRSLNSVG